MSDANHPDLQPEMRNMLMGFVVSRAVQVAAELGLADALANGPKGRDALAREVGAHADTMDRLLRTLASFGVFEKLADGRFANTRRSEYLQGDSPGSIRAGAHAWHLPACEAWAGLEHSVRSGNRASPHSRLTDVRISRGASGIGVALMKGWSRRRLDERGHR
jgi:hypothetical protein